jgi:hypothetical protein
MRCWQDLARRPSIGGLPNIAWSRTRTDQQAGELALKPSDELSFEMTVKGLTAQVLDEIRERLKPSRQSRGQFVGLHSSPTGPENVPDEYARVRLVVLGPTVPHVARAESSPALAQAALILQRRSASANRTNANVLVFLAASPVPGSCSRV